MLAQEYNITTVDELEEAIEEFHCGTLRLKDERHRSGWVHVVCCWEKQEQPSVAL